MDTNISIFFFSFSISSSSLIFGLKLTIYEEQELILWYFLNGLTCI